MLRRATIALVAGAAIAAAALGLRALDRDRTQAATEAARSAVAPPAPSAGAGPSALPAEPPAATAESRPRDEPRPAAVAKRPENRPPSLLPLVQPLWSELTPTQQFVLAPFADQWNTWPAAEKRAWVGLADRFPRLPQEQQARATDRIREWAALSPDERRLARQNYRLARKLPNEERVAQWQQYEALTPEQKTVLRSAGSTSNTAAEHAGARTALAKQAAKPIAPPPIPSGLPSLLPGSAGTSGGGGSPGMGPGVAAGPGGTAPHASAGTPPGAMPQPGAWPPPAPGQPGMAQPGLQQPAFPPPGPAGVQPPAPPHGP